MQGILNINKSKGLTSFDVIAKLRKLLNIKRIGHAGTLDPLATGVLPIFVGNTTRFIQYMPKTKAYRAYARLGVETNTYDTEGEIIDKRVCKYDIEEIKSALKTFEGKTIQTPPIYSAISVNGKRLYEYARKNIEVEIPQKEIEIFNIEVVDFQSDTDFPLLTFDINCASGVYVRSIIHDLGAKLNSCAMMENLTRTMSANLYLDNSITLEELTKDNAQNYFIDANTMIDFPEINLSEENLNKIKQGQYIFNQNDALADGYVKLTFNSKLTAIGIKSENIIKPKTVINI